MCLTHSKEPAHKSHLLINWTTIFFVILGLFLRAGHIDNSIEFLFYLLFCGTRLVYYHIRFNSKSNASSQFGCFFICHGVVDSRLAGTEVNTERTCSRTITAVGLLPVDAVLIVA